MQMTITQTHQLHSLLIPAQIISLRVIMVIVSLNIGNVIMTMTVVIGRMKCVVSYYIVIRRSPMPGGLGVLEEREYKQQLIMQLELFLKSFNVCLQHN